MLTLNPLLFSKVPNDAEVIPFPREETTPPVTKTNFAITQHSFKTFSPILKISLGLQVNRLVVPQSVNDCQ